MKRIGALILVAPLLVGPVVFLAAGVLDGMGASVLAAFVEQASGRRLNPLVGSVLGLVPAGLLVLALWIAHRRVQDPARLWAAAWSGLAILLLLLAWGHWSVWSLFLPTRGPLSFPHGLELVIVPLFFAPPAVLVGAFVGWLASGRR